VQIGRLPARTDVPDTIPGALAARASTLGHRPAVTMLGPGGREEQGFASLAQWAAKGAHLLQLDLLLQPRDRIAIVGPPGWMPAAIAHAAWWAGLVVTDGGADVAVVHADHLEAVDAGELLVWGDEVDGTPATDAGPEPWAVAVQAFPDQPPAIAASPDAPALDLADDQRTHADVVAALRDQDGTLGVEAVRSPGLADWLTPLAARPAVTGRATVLLREGTDRSAAEGERVTRWLDDAPASD
jgi:hypothetical protein